MLESKRKMDSWRRHASRYDEVQSSAQLRRGITLLTHFTNKEPTSRCELTHGYYRHIGQTQTLLNRVNTQIDRWSRATSALRLVIRYHMTRTVCPWIIIHLTRPIGRPSPSLQTAARRSDPATILYVIHHWRPPHFHKLHSRLLATTRRSLSCSSELLFADTLSNSTWRATLITSCH